jgi:outer membrane murein-binding lipoprotein Lpp
MPWWTWVALGIFVASLVAASVIGILMLSSLKALQATSERLATALEDLSAKGEALERRAERAQTHVESAEPHFEHLKATLDRFSVLSWALGDVAKTIGALRSAVLVRK